ncbi:YCF48-related protein [Psychroserpens ponticola]|uniref:YCF48-related protein n=1 Tax=Psychroserpens ponticola TaxID=2932268 RepID=A0ABY7RYN7_9FLAO|nr:YCF48-related protein [Psychroserpens ponticola]WCO00810.1 YCF48-related protein [Psychroserpens ponticola]
MKLLNVSKCLCILFVSFLSFQSIAQTWQTLNANTFGWRFEDMQFVDTEIGWVVDGGGQILKTTNGGVNWTQQYYNSDRYFRSVEFYNEQIGFAGTLANGNPTATLLKTIDGGITWTNISSNLPVDVPGICGMHMVNENTIFITGVFYGSAYIMKSTDQGDTWIYTNMGNLCNALVDIHFKDENIGYAAGQSAQGTGLRGIIVRTVDGGQTWNTVTLGEDSNERIWKIQELNDSVMYGSVEAHTDILEYYKSIDGGLTWQLNSIPSAGIIGTIQGIGFLNEDIGWVGGFGELFYETLDGGQTWEYKPTTGTSFNRFQRVNDTLMYTSGTNVYKYSDPLLLSIEDFEITKPKGHSISIKDSNIIKDNAVIKLQLINNTYCELSIYNTIGQRLKTLTQGKRNVGDYEIPFNVNSLVKGQYFVVLYTYHGYESIKIVVD